MELFMPRDDGIHNGDPDAAADVAEQIVEAACVADLLVFQKCHGGCGKRNEDASGSKTADQNRPDESPLPDAKIDLAEP